MTTTPPPAKPDPAHPTNKQLKDLEDDIIELQIQVAEIRDRLDQLTTGTPKQ